VLFRSIRIYKTIIFPVVLYGCETWSLTLREEHRLRVLRIFGPKRDEVTGDWRKLCKLVLFTKYNYNDHVKADEMSRACSTDKGEEDCV
jgi:hypothetical protein